MNGRTRTMCIVRLARATVDLCCVRTCFGRGVFIEWIADQSSSQGLDQYYHSQVHHKLFIDKFICSYGPWEMGYGVRSTTWLVVSIDLLHWEDSINEVVSCRLSMLI